MHRRIWTKDESSIVSFEQDGGFITPADMTASVKKGGGGGCSYGNHDTEYIQRIERSRTIFHQTFDVQKSDANGYESEAAEDGNAAQDDLDGVPSLLALGLHADEVLPLIAIARVAAGALLLLLPL